jgi:hypothetical protein
MWMNEWEVEDAVERFTDETPNLHRGVGILSRLMRWTNNNSDGWPYWQKPSNAAGKLMDHLHAAMRSYAVKDITEAELKKALSPIKAFLTKQGVDHALILEEPPPAPRRAPLTVEQGAALHTQIAEALKDAEDGLLEVVKTRLRRLQELVDDLVPDVDEVDA